jgi:putative transposase
MPEPQKNGVIEKFNGHYEQKFLYKVTVTSFAELVTGSLAFENRHKSRYRYSKLCGKTPLMVLSNTKAKLYFPTEAPVHPFLKPETGRYHLDGSIRNDRKLNMFGEMFSLPPEFQYEFVMATVDVKELNLNIFLGYPQVDEFYYKLR